MCWDRAASVWNCEAASKIEEVHCGQGDIDIPYPEVRAELREKRLTDCVIRQLRDDVAELGLKDGHLHDFSI